MSRYRLGFTAALLTVIAAGPANAGPYAKAAAQVRANGGELLLVASGGLERASLSELESAARRVCHTIALEGVTVTSVRIVTDSGQLIRLVGTQALAQC